MHSHASSSGARRDGWSAAAPASLLIALATVLLTVSCSSSSSNKSFPITGTFSNGSLSGHYAFVLSGTRVVLNNGIAVQSAYREAGVFTANGSGTISAGTEDLQVAGTFPGFSSAAITGTYGIGKDGNGTISLNLGTGTENWAITMVSSSKFYLSEIDASPNFSANASGQAEQQDQTVLNTIPSGTFAFRVHQTLPTPPSTAIVGQLTATAGSAAGQADTIQNGLLSASPQTVTGTFAALDSAGRGTFNAAIGGFSSTFNYYIVNATTFLLLESDSNILGLGRAEAQSAPFGAAPLTGSYAFGSRGDTQNNVAGVNSVGALAVSGTALTGNYDSNRDGALTANQALSGTINSLDPATGRVTVAFTPAGSAGAIQEVWYLVSPTRAFSVIYYPNLPQIAEDGVLDQQVGAPFSNSTLSGQYAILMGGYISNGLVTRVGTFIPDGNGNLNANESVNVYTPGSGNTSPSATVNAPVYVKGATYKVDASGRVTANSNDLVLYMVSGNQAYVLQGDTGVQVFGPMEIQH